MSKTANIIGAGMGGLAIAIRLATQGYKVTVFEKNEYAGGKLSELKLQGFRFDKGPSLFTMPELVDELTEISHYPEKFKYQPLDTITHYFYEDGTKLKASADLNAFAQEVKEKLQEDEEDVLNYLKKNRFYYETTADLFLHQSLSQYKNFLNLKTLKGIIRSPRLGLFSTMHAHNTKAFKNKKTTQLFNRYATYNGSNPYKAPALMNMISHLEFGMGAYLPEKGMHQITEHLVKLAESLGVTIKYGESVEEILIKNDRISAIKSNHKEYPSDIVVSDVDIHVLYNRLLPKKYYPEKLLRQEKSSSAYVFYWGINREYPELGLHNILFSHDYQKEFDALFGDESPVDDPTIYINITSKYCREDAPGHSENWFVMVNVPHNKKDSIPYAAELRKNVIRKINRILHTNIEQHIVAEDKLDPIDIEKQTSSHGGSLYGNSSNNKFSAFLRHSNYSTKIKGLYLVGGSVHPGGGIPLCLLSAKIASQLITDKENMK